MYVRDVAHEHRASVDLLDGKCIDGFNDVRRIVHRERVVLVSDLHVAGRENHILMLQGGADIRRIQAARLQRMNIEVGHDHARLAAIGIRNLRAVHHRQRGANDVLAQIVEFGVRQRFA